MEFLFFDIETEKNPRALAFLHEPTPPANYKDPEKIAAYIAEKKIEQEKDAALDPDYGMITAISTRKGVSGEKITEIVDANQSESDLIRWFWLEYAQVGGYVCGYNIIGFDLPYLFRRSLDLQIQVPNPPVYIQKYRTEPIRDLMGILYNWGPARGLKWVCKRYGIENPLPDLDGSKYASMDKETRLKYVENDVNLTVELYKLMSGVYF